ncbi:hypothetical protein A2U01_0001956, partial [Trifolium medium]|nr:hypothetical protein [Trifolium medium]
GQVSAHNAHSAPNVYGHYGLILDLLHVKIYTEALITLAQFYDAPDQGPYLGLGEKLTQDVVDEVLHLSVRDMAPCLETKGNTKGFSRKHDNVETILSCGEYRNVPLMGTKGCINYDLILALRQLGYTMEDKSDDGLLESFILREGFEDLPLFKKIRKAWGYVHKKEIGRKNCLAKPPYTQWVKERVKVIKLSFAVVVPARPLSPEPIVFLTIKTSELEFVLNIKVVVLYLSFPTYICASQSDTRS